jgi:hypothetical protein
MWGFRIKELPSKHGRWFGAVRGGQAATLADVIRAWQRDEAFRARFNEQLAAAPYKAFRWETPPVTEATATRPFEFVLLDSPGLAQQSDPRRSPDTSRRRPKPVSSCSRISAAMRSWSCPARRARLRLTAISRPSSGRRLSRSGTLCGKRSARRWRDGSGPSRCGSARPGPGCRGCTCGWMIGPSIMASSRIGGASSRLEGRAPRGRTGRRVKFVGDSQSNSHIVVV